MTIDECINQLKHGLEAKPWCYQGYNAAAMEQILYWLTEYKALISGRESDSLSERLAEHLVWAESSSYECPVTLAEDLQEAINCLQDVSSWIQCKDRLPDEGTEVLAVCNGFDGFGNPKRMYVLAKLENGSWIEQWCLSTLAFEVVEWMPLPDPNGGDAHDS